MDFLVLCLFGYLLYVVIKIFREDDYKVSIVTKAYGQDVYNENIYYKTHSIVEVGSINNFIDYEVNVRLQESYSNKTVYEIRFALEDTYNAVKLLKLDKTVIGDYKEVERYLDKVYLYLYSCENIEDCKELLDMFYRDTFLYR